MKSAEIPAERSYLLATGFGTTVAMWAAAYVCRLPAVMAPSWLLLSVLLGCLVCGGLLAGRLTGAGLRAGATTGAVSSLLNLLVLGSLLGGARPNELRPGALAWVPGSILAGAALGALGGALGSRLPRPREPRPDWTAAFSKVAALTTLLLIVAGGLVTSQDAGLAVVDWPNSYGYNMFLFPLSRMTGGIYYEHAHRLFGSLLGLTTLALAVHLHLVETRRWVKRLSLLVAATVVVQGILGGLRVTQLNVHLAVVHGVVAQIVFAAVVALCAVTSRSWKEVGPTTVDLRWPNRRGLGWVLVGLLLAQLIVGALLRHLGAALALHVSLAAVILPVGILWSLRALRCCPESSVVRRMGGTLVVVTVAQVLLGIGAFMATRVLDRGAGPSTLDVTLTTAHQGTGALVLGSAVALLLWSYRVLLPASTPA